MRVSHWSRVFFVASISVVGACVDLENDVGGDAEDDVYGELVAGAGTKTAALTVSGRWIPDADVLAVGDTQTVQYDGAPPYDGGANCSGDATPGSRILRDVIVAGFPQVDSVGIYNCRVIAGTNSMSIHGVGRALDIMISTEGGDADNGSGDPIAAWLIENAETLGVQGVIWDHSIWTTSRAPGSRHRAYNGENPHVDHVHAEINDEASVLGLPWYAAPAGPTDTAEPCPALPRDGGVVDAGPCQRLFGPAQYWRTEAAGHDGQLRWTNAYQGDRPSNWSTTTIKVDGGGSYDVDAFLDPAFAEYPATRYRIAAADGEHVVVVDQGARAAENGGWARLGTFDVGADGLVITVEDNAASDPGTARRIVVDAFRATPPTTEPTPTEPEPTPDPTEPKPDPTDPTNPDDGVVDDDGADEAVVTAEDRVIVVHAGGCASTSTPQAWAPGALLLLALRRRRR